MARIFNIAGCCDPEWNYMVDLTGRLQEIKTMIDNGMYFTINRARQFGKTTILAALAEYLRTDYRVISMDFQVMSALSFESEQSFVSAFSDEILELAGELPGDIEAKLSAFTENNGQTASLRALFKVLKA